MVQKPFFKFFCSHTWIHTEHLQLLLFWILDTCFYWNFLAKRMTKIETMCSFPEIDQCQVFSSLKQFYNLGLNDPRAEKQVKMQLGPRKEERPVKWPATSKTTITVVRNIWYKKKWLKQICLQKDKIINKTTITVNKQDFSMRGLSSMSARLWPAKYAWANILSFNIYTYKVNLVKWDYSLFWLPITDDGQKHWIDY